MLVDVDVDVDSVFFELQSDASSRAAELKMHVRQMIWPLAMQGLQPI